MERVLVGFEGARIIEFAGGAIGLLKMIKGERAWDIVQIQLLPEWQGQGIGALLLSQALAEAAEAKATVLLSVLKVNKARRLYERLGFSVISEDENSYSMRAMP
ncbi:Acetyltransferase (GNAT) domain-containing protein [Pseudoduganella namucuonensis]|uniref:Acetyltransferase (GNAT) domain-containing protein n=2 Tax=Pseudoduganella namucuonensis TaxID=1035707 RepID=A0A1I7EUJ3_9BURK|nr:Acetyltransferase (GNAT) domain-containing protein [Pseudoduganella namucuonensis]